MTKLKSPLCTSCLFILLYKKGRCCSELGPISKTYVKQHPEEDQQSAQEGNLYPQGHVLHSQIPEQHFRIVKVAVHLLVAVQPLAVIAENHEDQRDESAADEGGLHDAVHKQGYVRSKVETINCESEEGRQEQGTSGTAVLKGQ